MNSNTINNLPITLLKQLGNNKPTQRQINLAKQLLTTAVILQPLSFAKQLSEQERNCLLLAAKGMTSAQTASLLKIKKTTVETHRRKVLRKLSCNTLTQAVYQGICFGQICRSC